MLPEAFLSRIRTQLGEEYDSFLASLERPRAVALRFNPLKGELPALPFVGENVPWEPLGYYYDPDSRPGLHPFHEAGVYYLQEASAMSAVALLEPQPGEKICDLCAAPGGKAGSHGLQGIGANFVPEVLNTAVYDEVIPVTEEEAYAAGRALGTTQGILAGISSGAALHGALVLANRPENAGKTIVVLLPDTGDRYLSTALFG